MITTKDSNFVWVSSQFPIWIHLEITGRVLIKDLLGNLYQLTHKDGLNLSYAEYQSIIDDKIGFWDLAKRFKLIQQ